VSRLLALAGGLGRQTSGRRSKKGPAALALAAGAAGLAVAKRRRSNGAGDAPDRHLDVASEPREEAVDRGGHPTGAHEAGPGTGTQEPPSPIDADSEDVAQRGV
jgi:hypothetical protein